MCQFCTSNAFSGSAKHFGINFPGLHFNIASKKSHFYKKKTNYQQKMGHRDEKPLKTVI